jgi:uncharacterized protein YabN with tetrapyrrole methylase and pyrophosphatase domain
MQSYVDRIKDWNVRTGQMAEDVGDRAEAWRKRDSYRDLTKRIFLEEVNEVLDSDPEDDVELLDGIADVFFTLIGLAGKAGLEDYVVPVIEEVMASNESKLKGEVVFRADGKVGKGSEYFPPDIPSVMQQVDQNV